MGTPDITCRFCSGTDCEHGDHCNDCGCPQCGMPGARTTGPDLLVVRGFCHDCDWEAAPGVRQNWYDRQPKLTNHQKYRQVMEFLGVDLPPDDEVGTPIFPNTNNYEDRS